jgi:plastocyanin
VRPRRTAAAALVVAALALAAVNVAPDAGAKPDDAPPGPTRLLVRGYEFNLLLSALKVNPGNAIVQFVNQGEDPHDLQIQRLGDPEQVAIPELPGGEVGEVGLKLRRDSRYVLWCSLSNHRELGMEASVRVRRKKR